MSNARNLANLLGTGTQIKTDKVADEVFQANDSLIINGDMAIAQRGVSSAAHTTGYPCVDRFKSGGVTAAGAVTMSQSTDAPDGFVHSLKMDVTTADTSLAAGEYYIPCTQVIEAQNLQHLNYGTSEAKPFTLSFWVKSNKPGTYTVEVYNQDSTTYINVKPYTINTADTWEYKTITFEANTNTAANIANDNGAGLYINWWVAAGSTYNDGTGTLETGWNTVTNNKRASGVPNMLDNINNEWLITGVKMEIGDTSTPFKHISYAENLHQCRRYYQELTGWGKVFHVHSSTAAYAMFEFNPEMRATPTLTATTTDFRFYSGGDVETISQMNLQNITNRQFQFYLQGSGFNAGRAGHLDSRSNKFYTAEAEL